MGIAIKDIIKIGENRLAGAGVEDAKVDAELLICYMIGVTRNQLFMKWPEELGDAQCDHYFELLERRASGTPLQHITGSQEFMGLNFTVNEDVLIPRRDTEILAEEAIRMIRKEGKKKPKVLDLCTGSGILAITMAKFFEEGTTLPSEFVEDEETARRKRIYEMLEVSTNETMGRQHIVMSEHKTSEPDRKGGNGDGVVNAEITASDISEKALEVAKKNAAANGVKPNFVLGDMFASFRRKLGGNKRFDYIITNPPYIPTGVIATLQTEVKDHEPMLALDGGEDGLDCYREIIKNAPDFLTEEGVLLMEIGHDQADAIKDIVAEIATMVELSEEGKKKKKNAFYFSSVEIIPDLAGLDRVAILR